MLMYQKLLNFGHRPLILLIWLKIFISSFLTKYNKSKHYNKNIYTRQQFYAQLL